MKKIISIISCIVALTAVTSCDWFKLDNLDGWDASVEGKIIDSATGEPIQMEQGGSISVYEIYGTQYDHTNQKGVKGWDGKNTIGWTVKNNGTYVNKLTFAGDYKMKTINNNFQADTVWFSLNSGKNVQDFKVDPYVRIKNPKISISGKVINATCELEIGVPGTKISRVELCVWPDRWVRHSYNNCSGDPYSYVVNPAVGTTISLSVDPDRVVKSSDGKTETKPNAEEFQYDRIHYIRIAALGNNGQNTSSAYNYSPVYKLEKNGTLTEVTDW